MNSKRFWTTISNIFSNIYKLTFKVDIPGTGLTEYLKYRLMYFPVLAKDNFLRTVNALSSIVMNNERGSMISSMTCFGENPELCMRSKELVAHTCEYGFETNNGVKDCKIEILKKRGASDVVLIDADVFIVSPYERLPITKRCRGQAPYTQVNAKPIKISVFDGCVPETSELRNFCFSALNIKSLPKFHLAKAVYSRTHEGLQV